jgi:hypothetical protein
VRSHLIQPGLIETDTTAKINSNPVTRTMSEHTMGNTILLRRTGRADSAECGQSGVDRDFVASPPGGAAQRKDRDHGCSSGPDDALSATLRNARG